MGRERGHQDARPQVPTPVVLGIVRWDRGDGPAAVDMYNLCIERVYTMRFRFFSKPRDGGMEGWLLSGGGRNRTPLILRTGATHLQFGIPLGAKIRGYECRCVELEGRKIFVREGASLVRCSYGMQC